MKPKTWTARGWALRRKSDGWWWSWCHGGTWRDTIDVHDGVRPVRWSAIRGEEENVRVEVTVRIVPKGGKR